MNNINRIIIITLLILVSVFSLGKITSYANEGKNIDNLNLNKKTRIDDNSNIFNMSGEGKNKTQFRMETKHDNTSRFMVKGLITASSNNMLTIARKNIKIDPQVTGNVKIVGGINIGSYAMIKGIEIDSALYAEKIVVNQRNKNNFEDEFDNEDEIATKSATPTPTVILQEDEDSTTTAKLDFSNIINSIQGFLNYLVGIASKI
jgi:hypothetical protein